MNEITEETLKEAMTYTVRGGVDKDGNFLSEVLNDKGRIISRRVMNMSDAVIGAHLAALGWSNPDNTKLLNEENSVLRAKLSHSKDPCMYCGLKKEDMSRCQSGFPGCARGDDMAGCPDFGASMMLVDAERKISELTAKIDIALNALNAIDRLSPCNDGAGTWFYPQFGPEGEDRGYSIVDPASIMQQMAVAAQDAILKLTAQPEEPPIETPPVGSGPGKLEQP